MAAINEVYGKEYVSQAFTGRINFLSDQIAANFANLNFQVKYDYGPLFNQGKMAQNTLKQICQKTEQLNPNLIVTSLDKETDDLKMLPYLLTIPAEYFRIIDLNHKKIYLIYVSTENLEAY